MEETTGSVAVTPATNGNHANRILLTLVGVALLVNYVETMVLPGIPTIQNYFSTTATIASWITSAYLISGAAASALFGKLGDSYGKKKMFLISLIFYMVGVAIAGFSPSIYFLLFARGLQGVGFAIIPLSLAIIADAFPKEKIGTAQGVISGTFAIGAAAGLIIGSYIVQDLGWQYAFHTALILSLVLFAVVAKVLKKDKPSMKQPMDYVGAAFLMTGISLVLVYITEGPALGWLSLEELALLLPGLVLTLLFFVYERNKTNPMVQLSLLRIRNVLVANLVGLFSAIVMFMLFFAVVYYARIPPTFGLGLGVIAAGLTMAPSTLGMMATGPSIGKMMARFGPKPVLLMGSVLQILGFLLFIFNRGTRLDIAADLVLALAGVVSIIVPIVNMIAISVPRENVAVGLGMNTLLRNLGGAIGPVLATVIMSTYTSQLVIAGHPVPGEFFANSTAFNFIFVLGITLSFLIIGLSLATKNYTFSRSTANNNTAH